MNRSNGCDRSPINRRCGSQQSAHLSGLAHEPALGALGNCPGGEIVAWSARIIFWSSDLSRADPLDRSVR